MYEKYEGHHDVTDFLLQYLKLVEMQNAAALRLQKEAEVYCAQADEDRIAAAKLDCLADFETDIDSPIDDPKNSNVGFKRGRSLSNGSFDNIKSPSDPSSAPAEETDRSTDDENMSKKPSAEDSFSFAPAYTSSFSGSGFQSLGTPPVHGKTGAFAEESFMTGSYGSRPEVVIPSGSSYVPVGIPHDSSGLQHMRGYPAQIQMMQRPIPGRGMTQHHFTVPHFAYPVPPGGHGLSGHQPGQSPIMVPMQFVQIPSPSRYSSSASPRSGPTNPSL